MRPLRGPLIRGVDTCGDDLGLVADELAQDTQVVTGTGRQIDVFAGTVETGDDLNALWGLILSELESGRPLLLHAQGNPDLAHAGASHAVTVVGLVAGQGPPRIVVHDSSPGHPHLVHAAPWGALEELLRHFRVKR